MIGADLVKNEITAHAVATMSRVPDVQTIFEIGGQDSKIIIIRDGVITDFGMNLVCAAGTGSFLEHQAERLNIRIEDFGGHALKSENPARIAGRCTVFAESDMVHKQQMGYLPLMILSMVCARPWCATKWATMATEQNSKDLALARQNSRCLLLCVKLAPTFAKSLKFLPMAMSCLDGEGVVTGGKEQKFNEK